MNNWINKKKLDIQLMRENAFIANVSIGDYTKSAELRHDADVIEKLIKELEQYVETL